MATFASQDITVGDTPISFDKNILNKKPSQHAAIAAFTVENGRIRMTAVPNKNPTPISGRPGEVGQSVVISDEADIRNFKAIAVDSEQAAFIHVEFSEDEKFE